MGRASRDKGSKVEREIAKKLSDAGIPSRRVIGSGAYGGLDSRLAGDLQIGTYGPEDGGGWLLTGEVKARKGAAGFTQLERWLGKNDLLLLRRNNQEAFAFMPWSTLVPLLEAFYRSELEEVPDGDNQHNSGDVPSSERLHGGSK